MKLLLINYVVNFQVIHEGRTCFEYQDDLVIANNTDEAKRRTTEQLENMIKTKEAMPCPKCGIILTKVDGCDGMNCTVCKTAICWATRGPRWGPGVRFIKLKKIFFCFYNSMIE